MKEQRPKTKSLQRRAAAPPSVQRAPAAGAQRGLGNARLGAMPTPTALSRIRPQVVRRESDGDEGLLRYRGGAGERGIGVLYVQKWSTLSTEEQKQVKNFARAMDIEAASGLTRQRVTAADRRAANKVAGVARIALDLGPDTAAGHIPDVGAGGNVLGPISGKPRKVNLSFGGQLNRYRPGFVFTGFTVYDFESGQLIYTSGQHSSEPAAMAPGAPPRDLAGPGAVASGVEAASRGQPTTSIPVPEETAPRTSSLQMLPPGMPVLAPSASGLAFEAGGLLILSGLNALFNWLGGNRQSERAARAGAEVMPVISKHLKEHPGDGVLIIAFYHQIEAPPDSLMVPGPVFSHLEYEFGETQEKAFESFKSKPALRPYYPNERDVRQSSWLPPTKLPAMQPLVLPQLEVGRIDDPAEREAEDLVNRIMRVPAGGACCPACASGGPCVSHVEEIEQGQVGPIRRQPSGNSHGLTVSADVEPQVRQATSGGEVLPEAVRASFEPRFGQDLSHVRIHRDAAAAESASSLGARAYTLGDHIAFASGRWAPGTEAGDRLIAHELTHVLQQDSPGRMAAGPIRRDRAGEQDVKSVISREALAQHHHLEAVGAQLARFLEKRRSGIKSLLVEFGPDPKSAQAKERARYLREDLDKDLATIRRRPDSKPVHPGLRADILRSARALEAARNKLNSLNRQWTKYDAVFSGKEVAAKLGTSLAPAQLKALIAQESYDLTRNEVKGDKVGVAQMGSAEAKEAGGTPSDRKVPEKAIPLAATRLAGVAGHLDKSMKAKVTGIERTRLIMAAYNGGANLIITAQRFAIEMKRDGKTWQSLIEGEKDSPLYRALKATYRAGTEDDKFKEITKYVHNIEPRLSPAPDFWP